MSERSQSATDSRLPVAGAAPTTPLADRIEAEVERIELPVTMHACSVCGYGHSPREQGFYAAMTERLRAIATELRAARGFSEQPEVLARQFHDTYEALAPEFSYTTRKETRIFDPKSPNGRLMIAVIRSMLGTPGGEK